MSGARTHRLPGRWWWVLAAVVILGGGGWWAWRAGSARQAIANAAVQLGDLNEYVSCNGALAAQQAAVLIAPSRVQNLRIVYLAPGGSQVKKGQVVIRLDVSGLQQKAKELALALQTAQATLNQAQDAAAITHQQDLLTLVEDQVAAGHAQNSARKAAVQSRIAGQESALDLDTAKAQVVLAQATGKLHETASAANLQSLREARDKAAAQLQREQAAVAQATLRSPLAGVITYSMNYTNFNDQHPYRVGDTVSAGDEIAQIPNLSTLMINANLPQTDRGQVQVGDAVSAQAAALPEAQLSGTVQSIADLTSLDFSGSYPPPRVFALAVSLTDPDARLRPQMNVTVKIITRQLRHVDLVPAQAVFNHNGQAIVYLQQGGRYQLRHVTVLGSNPTETAIRGVSPGERVALVEPGAKPAATSASAANPAGLEDAKP